VIAEVLGSGPDLALIPGWGLGSAAWRPLLAPLARHCRVHLVELPGYGGTPPIAAGFGETAQALLATLPAGVTLCGWSLGGLLALRAAADAPERLSRLILVGATASFAQRPDWPAAQPPALLEQFVAAVREDAAGTLQRFIALLNQGDAQARMLNRALQAAIAAAPPPDPATLASGLAWLRDIDLRALPATLAAPTLLLHGERDPLMPLAAARWLADTLPEARLEIFAGAAHAPFLADLERFTGLVADFCRGAR
jgi:pimeloyl-[acyl-carrier protein] methyl ester esterase